jgi:hypothetical protein
MKKTWGSLKSFLWPAAFPTNPQAPRNNSIAGHRVSLFHCSVTASLLRVKSRSCAPRRAALICISRNPGTSAPLGSRRCSRNCHQGETPRLPVIDCVHLKSLVPVVNHRTASGEPRRNACFVEGSAISAKFGGRWDSMAPEFYMRCRREKNGHFPALCLARVNA